MSAQKDFADLKGIAVTDFTTCSTLNQTAGTHANVVLVAAYLSGLFAVTALLGFSGCRPDSSTALSGEDKEKETVWQVETEMAASEIVSRMQREYLQADAYQDNASLHLAYRLQGSYLAEPHPWEVRFQRGKGLNLDLYEARIRSDQRRMSCFIYDFSSGNLDNQWQVHPLNGGPPLRQFFQDGICRHYITGQNELPVDPSNADSADAFFPPTIGLLTGEMTQDWLTSGTAERLADEEQDGRTCFQIRMTHHGLHWDLMIDAETWLLRSIRYPVQLLDSQLNNNPAVENLEVVARFTGATFEANFEASVFDLSIPDDAKIVSQFVAVPEPFPSNHVGKKVGELGLRTPGNRPVLQDDWKGKITLLFFNDPEGHSGQLISTLQTVADQLSVKQYAVARVEVFTNALPGNTEISERLDEMAQASKVPVLADFGFNAGRMIGLTHYPVFAVIDRGGVLQYVKSLQDAPMSSEEILAVMVRVRSGDDVAAEMRREYEAFLDLYQERLAAVRTDAGAGRDDGKISEAAPPEHIRLEKRWASEQVQQPGNILHEYRNNRPVLTLLDGWRTVIQMDESGQLLNRKVLKLDSRESINIIRTGDQQPDLSLVFSVMGQTVRILDDRLQSIKTIQPENDKQRIRDANLFDIDCDGDDELLVSYTGKHGTDIVELGKGDDDRQVIRHSIRSSAIVSSQDGSRSLVFCDANAKLMRIRLDGDLNNALAEQVSGELVAATRVVAGKNTRGADLLCVIGTNQQGQWIAEGRDSDFQKTWSVSIGSQRFESQIESITHSQLPGTRSGIWAIAASDGSVKLIGDDGKLIDNWNLGTPIHGIELFAVGNEYVAVLSTDGQIQAWSLAAGGGAVRSTSSTGQ